MRAVIALLAAISALIPLQADSAPHIASANSGLVPQTDSNYPNVEAIVPPSLEETLVERDLPWSTVSLEFAKESLSAQKKAFETSVSQLTAAGAESVIVVSDRQILMGKPFQDASLYIGNLHPWHLEGVNARGKYIGRSRQFPADPLDMSNYLLRPTRATCSILERHWWNPLDWFKEGTCQLTKVESSAYLRASLATAMKKATIGQAGSWLIPQLDFALASDCELTIKHDQLYCNALAQIMTGGKSIKLSGKSKLGGYLITVDIAKRKAIYRATGIDQKALAREAKVFEGENYVRFF